MNLCWIQEKLPMEMNMTLIKWLSNCWIQEKLQIEVKKEKERGVAILILFGPNKRNVATVMINKWKKNDIKFVETLAIDVIKQLLDRFDSEDGWLKVIKVIQNIENQKKKQHFCHVCNNGFATEKDVKVHIEKFQQLEVNYSCEVCDYKG